MRFFGRRNGLYRFKCPQCKGDYTARKIGEPNQWELKHPHPTRCTVDRTVFLAAFHIAVNPPSVFAEDLEGIWERLKGASVLGKSN